MGSTFSKTERQTRTKIRRRAAQREAAIDDDRAEVFSAIVKALAPFPEARAAVLAALANLGDSGG